MEKVVKVVRPYLFNALGLVFIKNVIIATVLVLLLLYVDRTLLISYTLGFDSSTVLLFVISLGLLFVIAPLLIEFIILSNTTYTFFAKHILKEFKFIIIRRYSVPYTQIVNITTEISLWDRITKSGDVVIHTAENVKKDLNLAYVKQPRALEKYIYQFMAHPKHPPHIQHR